MFEIVRLIVALIGGIICGVYDLKTTNMLDYVSYVMIGIGIVLSLAEYILTSDATVLFWSFLVGLFYFLFSLWMYKKGYWGGGDGEMLVAYGVLLPLGMQTDYFFFLKLILSIFFIGGIYSLFYSLFIVIKNRKNRKIVFSRFAKLDIVLLLLSIGSFLIGLLTKGNTSKLFFLLSLLLVYRPVVNYSKTIEKEIFVKRIHVRNLKEGDVLGEDIPKLNLRSKEIRGLTKEEIKKIRKIRKYVKIKEGVPFIPVFPLALLFSIYFFDLLIPIHYFIG